jgi:hypothetical protein
MHVLLVGLLLTAVPGWVRAGERPWDLGLHLAASAPAGAVAALTTHPFVPWARLHGGLTWNYFAYGLQAGVTVAPWRSWATPTATVEGGKSFDADLRSPLSGLNFPAAMRPSLSSAGYTYVSALLGLELGDPGRTTFFVRAGLTRAWSTLNGIDHFASGSGSVLNSSPIHLAAWAPAASIGLAVGLW